MRLPICVNKRERDLCKGRTSCATFSSDLSFTVVETATLAPAAPVSPTTDVKGVITATTATGEDRSGRGQATLVVSLTSCVGQPPLVGQVMAIV